MHISFPTCNTWHLNTVTQKTIPSLKYQARRNNLLVPKGVITCRHRSKHSFGDVYFKRRYTIIKPDVILLLGYCRLPVFKAVPNEKHIPTCVPSFSFWIPVNIYFGKQ